MNPWILITGGVGMLLILWGAYRTGYKSGLLKGKTIKAKELLENDSKMVRALLDTVDDPNSAFKLRGK